MTSVWEFLRMGGYAAYVWPAYGLTAAVMLGLLVASLRSLKARRRELQRLEGLRGRRRTRRGDMEVEEVDTTA